MHLPQVYSKTSGEDFWGRNSKNLLHRWSSDYTSLGPNLCTGWVCGVPSPSLNLFHAIYFSLYLELLICFRVYLNKILLGLNYFKVQEPNVYRSRRGGNNEQEKINTTTNSLKKRIKDVICMNDCTMIFGFLIMHRNHSLGEGGQLIKKAYTFQASK